MVAVAVAAAAESAGRTGPLNDFRAQGSARPSILEPRAAMAAGNRLRARRFRSLRFFELPRPTDTAGAARSAASLGG